MSSTTKPDFEALRMLRNEAVRQQLEEVAARHGWDKAHIAHSFNFDACYCACASGGPCEHDFKGWREFADGYGGETVCTRCGMGSMAHTLRTAP